jgi:hypothetical protein
MAINCPGVYSPGMKMKLPPFSKRGNIFAEKEALNA